MPDLPNCKSFHIKIGDKHLAVAELSWLLVTGGLPESEKTWYFFNRIRVPDAEQGKGYGNALMDMVVAWADENQVYIYNQINPYGRLDLQALRKFYSKYKFESYKTDHEMIRRPTV